MKSNPLFAAALSLAAAILPAVSLFGQDPAFEQIDALKTFVAPLGGLVNRGDGYFYGAASRSDNFPGGAVFRVAPRIGVEILHTFPPFLGYSSPNVGGSLPSCGLILGPSGELYGATSQGGANGNGVIYRISVDGTFSVVHDFAVSDGQTVQSLLLTSNGELFGATLSGGLNYGGTLFKIGTDRVFKVLYDFDGHVPLPGTIAPPSAPLMLHEGPAGYVYGISGYGGLVYINVRIPSSRGTLFRYDGANSITVLTNFDEYGNPGMFLPTSDGFYVGGGNHLIHVDLDGTARLEVDSSFFGNSVYLKSLRMGPDGIYGVTDSGGTNDTGFAFRFVPGEGMSRLVDFPSNFAYRIRHLIHGNDGLPYGRAAPPYLSKKVADRPLTFRLRALATQSPNFVPVVNTDTAWLPATALNGTRSVVVDVLANDRDPERGPLTLTSILPPQGGAADIVWVAGKPRLRFTTSETDPAGRSIRYQIKDANGGTAVGTAVIRSLVTGKYRGIVTDQFSPISPISTLTVTVGSKNSLTITFQYGVLRYTGKGTLEADETLNTSLTLLGSPPLNLRLSLSRGPQRFFLATIQGGGMVYMAACSQTAN